LRGDSLTVARVEVAAIRKADGAEIRVGIDRYKGRRVVDIRIWFQPGGSADYVASGKGVTFDADKLPEFARAIEEAVRLL
jgi:Transcriptional Coactivator p15 (PC4)